MQLEPRKSRWLSWGAGPSLGVAYSGPVRHLFPRGRVHRVDAVRRPERGCGRQRGHLAARAPSPVDTVVCTETLNTCPVRLEPASARPRVDRREPPPGWGGLRTPLSRGPTPGRRILPQCQPRRVGVPGSPLSGFSLINTFPGGIHALAVKLDRRVTAANDRLQSGRTQPHPVPARLASRRSMRRSSSSTTARRGWIGWLTRSSTMEGLRPAIAGTRAGTSCTGPR